MQQVEVTFPDFHAARHQDHGCLRQDSEFSARFGTKGIAAPGWWYGIAQNFARCFGVYAIQRALRKFRIADCQLRNLARRQLLQPVSIECTVHPEQERDTVRPDGGSIDYLAPRR